MVAQKVTAGVYKGVTTTELDELAAETAASLTATHPDYALVSNIDSCITLTIHYLFCPWISRIQLTSHSLLTAARCSHCCLQPSQEHPQVFQRDVSYPILSHQLPTPYATFLTTQSLTIF